MTKIIALSDTHLDNSDIVMDDKGNIDYAKTLGIDEKFLPFLKNADYLLHAGDIQCQEAYDMLLDLNHNFFAVKGYYNDDNVKTKYAFSWDKIPGNEDGRFKEFFKNKFNIDWVNKAKIEKIDNGKTIKISTKKNCLSIKLNDIKTEAVLEIDDGRTDKFLAKTENCVLNIYYVGIKLQEEEPITTVEGVRVGLVHRAFGNNFSEVVTKAKDMDVQVLVFGHIHHPLIAKGERLLICPGYSRITPTSKAKNPVNLKDIPAIRNSRPSMAQITIESSGLIRAMIIPLVYLPTDYQLIAHRG